MDEKGSEKSNHFKVNTVQCLGFFLAMFLMVLGGIIIANDCNDSKIQNNQAGQPEVPFHKLYIS